MTLDARRLVRACLVAIAVFLATGGVVVGMAAADAEEELFVPAPRPGDRATYRIQQVVLDADTALGDLSYLSEASYEWLPEVAAIDRSFGQRSGHPLRTSYHNADETYTQETVYDGVTGAPMFGVFTSTEVVGDGMHYGIVLEDLIGSEGTTITARADWYTGALGPCGVRLPFKQAPAVGTVVEVAGNCDWPTAQPTLAFRAEGWQDEGGFLFTAVKDDVLRLWYDGNSPFPLRIQVPLTDTVAADYTHGRLFRLERVGHDRGESPYGTPHVAQGLGPGPTAPRPDWGIPDDGVDHAFPLSRAYQAALAETEDTLPLPGSGDDPTVAQFMASHPGTYLAYAGSSDLIDQQGQPHHAWWLLFTDGAERLGKMVKLEPRGAEAVFLPSQAGLVTSVHDWEPAENFAPADVRGIFPMIDRVPQTMPTAQGLLARHDVGEGASANAYGFVVRCDDSCADPVAEAFAAYAVSDLSSDVSFLGGSFVEDTSFHEATWLGSDGRLARHYQAMGEHDTPVPVVRSAVGSEGDSAGQGRPRLLTAGFATPAAGVAAAGVSLLGLLAGLLYYFWPSVKGVVGAGLFSRIDDGKVLEHPTRRRIHDAIAAEPGIHFQALSRKAGVGRGALDHHLRKLVAADLVTVRKAPGYTCYFVRGTVDRRLLDAAPSLRSDGSRAVLQAVAANPGASSRDLAAVLGVAPSTMSYHLKRLETAGLVTPGEKSGVRITPLGSQAAA